MITRVVGGVGVGLRGWCRWVGVRHRWGIRRQSMLVAGVVVTVALLVGAAVLLVVLQDSLISAARSNLSVRATDVARLLEEQGVAETQKTVLEDRRGGEQIQVLDPDGRVVVASDRRLRTAPMSGLRPGPGATASEKIPQVAALGDTDEFLVAARGIALEDRPYVVLAAVPVQVQTDTVRTVAVFLLAGTPPLVALVVVAVWLLVGRSLQAVDRIRRQVAAIDAQRLGTRVEVPATADELAELASTMNAMLDKLELSDRSQRAFFSDASHELRSPLSTLVTTAEVASRDPSGRSWVELQGTVLTESQRLQALVEDLLTMAKVDADGLRMVMVDVDLEDVVEREVRRLALVSQIMIHTHLEPVRVVGDELRLAQVVRNLLDNAARHARSTVTVWTQVEAGTAQVWVDNDGDPIAPEERERIFDRFVRLDAARSVDSGGSGLGLPIARALIEAHGGSLEVTALDDGSRFRIQLPVRS